MATSPDSHVLPPVSEAVSQCTPVAGEHGWKVLLHSCPACGFPVNSSLARVWKECWTRWALGLIQHGSSYVLNII